MGTDPFRDELDAAHRRIETLESEHRARIDRLEKENRRLQTKLADVAPSRTKTGQVFLALAVIMMSVSIGGGMLYARMVRPPAASTPVVHLLEDTTIELGPSPSSAAPADFDRDSVATALSNVAIGDCVDASHKPGSGHVRLVLLANGFVASAKVDRGDYATTSEGRCIEGRFRAAHVPTWTGSARTVGKSFEIH